MKNVSELPVAKHSSRSAGRDNPSVTAGQAIPRKFIFLKFLFFLVFFIEQAGNDKKNSRKNSLTDVERENPERLFDKMFVNKTLRMQKCTKKGVASVQYVFRPVLS